MTNVKNSRVLITGAASGIGRLLALRLAESGAKVVLWDIDRDGLDAMIEVVPMSALPEQGAAIMAGQTRGRIVVDPSA